MKLIIMHRNLIFSLWTNWMNILIWMSEVLFWKMTDREKVFTERLIHIRRTFWSQKLISLVIIK